jgi:hypothetical protein
VKHSVNILLAAQVHNPFSSRTSFRFLVGFRVYGLGFRVYGLVSFRVEDMHCLRNRYGAPDAWNTDGI